MSQPSNKKASRASTPKVRTGCITCNTGRKCDGYLPTPPATSRRKTTDPNARATPDRAILIRNTSSPPFELFDDDLERRSFNFFKTQTIPEISGFFPSDFWHRLVPLAAHHEPALKHAVIALASLHERFQKGDQSILKSNDAIAEGGFALQQYNKAIRHLVNPCGSKPNIDTSLVACILFACLEINDEERASPERVHSSERLCVPRECLDVIFTRLDHQRVQMIGSRPMNLPPPKINAQPGFHPDIPARFNSLEEARNNLDYQWHIFHQKAVDVHVKIISGIETEEHRAAHDGDRHHFKNEHRRWSTAFQAFLDVNAANMDSKAMQGAMVLKLTVQVFDIHLEISCRELLYDQNCWDVMYPVYEELIDIAAVVINADKVTDGPIVKPIFQMDHNIIGCLFSVAHRCRDPHLRRRAISLLYKVPRQEGVWNSLLTARVAERLMNIEEDGLGEVKCAADVPDWKRISDVEVLPDLQRKRSFIKYSRLRSYYSTVREPVTDVLEW
ncbi:MAG: hypothetical protein Q9211_005439 [Gyalolechia sp. 1 TL-2023]